MSTTAPCGATRHDRGAAPAGRGARDQRTRRRTAHHRGGTEVIVLREIYPQMGRVRWPSPRESRRPRRMSRSTWRMRPRR
ncbi:hypothetical protein CGL27_06160 [Streptomyces sp. 11-1-2]|nr:hypothetical protein CGL27_06160 [Streptomyces sp. 11-1-2]